MLILTAFICLYVTTASGRAYEASDEVNPDDFQRAMEAVESLQLANLLEDPDNFQQSVPLHREPQDIRMPFINGKEFVSEDPYDEDAILSEEAILEFIENADNEQLYNLIEWLLQKDNLGDLLNLLEVIENRVSKRIVDNELENGQLRNVLDEVRNIAMVTVANTQKEAAQDNEALSKRLFWGDQFSRRGNTYEEDESTNGEGREQSLIEPRFLEYRRALAPWYGTYF